MLADFQPRCIMIFMATSSEILLATRIAGHLTQPRNIRCLSATAAVLVAPSAIEKERAGFEQLDFLHSSAFGTAS